MSTREHTLTAWFLVGPTAAGKSAVAHELARRHGYALLSADAMQVYRGLDIGTDKPAADERAGLDYYGLDLVDADGSWSAWDYLRYAQGVLRKLRTAGRECAVVGGTGLYVRALTDGLEGGPGPDPALRARWADARGGEPLAALQSALRERDPEAYRALADKRNPRRLLRALEKAMAGGGTPERGSWKGRRRARLTGLLRERAELNARIERRVREMYARGLLEEAERLRGRYGRLSAPAARAIGYAEAFAVLDGACTQEEAVERTTVRTRQLARRQMTWFRGQADVQWVRVEPGATAAETAERVRRQWGNDGPTNMAV